MQYSTQENYPRDTVTQGSIAGFFKNSVIQKQTKLHLAEICAAEKIIKG